MKQARKKRRLTIAEFSAVRPLLNISEDRINAAYAALVEGRTLQSIGTEYGWSRQSVNDTVDVVYKWLDNYRQAQKAEINALNQELPPDWECALICGPKELIARMANFKTELATNNPGLTHEEAEIAIR
jgi:hypothetical protein